MTIADLTRSLQEFAVEREWEQFHTPKNLVMALAGEVGELTELFQWLTPEESAEIMSSDRRAAQVREEIADIFGYVLRFADVLGIDLEEALQVKMQGNADKYPVEMSRGVATKYTELGEVGPQCGG
jgi:NTP pyrophosphatase (non-canonical NTP hydrolase)